MATGCAACGSLPVRDPTLSRREGVEQTQGLGPRSEAKTRTPNTASLNSCQRDMFTVKTKGG